MQTINPNPNATSLVASAPAESVTPLSNLNRTNLASDPSAVLPPQSAARAITAEFLAGLDGLIGQTESLVDPLPKIDASNRQRILRQANADPGFATRLQTLLSRLDGEGTSPVPNALVEVLAQADAVLADKRSRLFAATGRVDDLYTLVRRELVLQLRIAKSALLVMSEQSPQALKLELAQVGGRFLGRRKRKARAKNPAAPAANGNSAEPTPPPNPGTGPAPHANT